MKKPLYVTQPFLPKLDEFLPYLEEIWSSKILTNGGPFHRKLESELSEFLGVKQDGRGGLVHWESDQFQFLRSVCLPILTGSVGLILAKDQ